MKTDQANTKEFKQFLTMKHRKSLGKIITKVRKAKTQYAVAKEAGISIAALQAIELGDKSYTIDSLILVCKALNIDIHLLAQPADE